MIKQVNIALAIAAVKPNHKLRRDIAVEGGKAKDQPGVFAERLIGWLLITQKVLRQCNFVDSITGEETATEKRSMSFCGCEACETLGIHLLDVACGVEDPRGRRSSMENRYKRASGNLVVIESLSMVLDCRNKIGVGDGIESEVNIVVDGK